MTGVQSVLFRSGAERPEDLLGKKYTDFVLPDRSAAMEQLRAQMLHEWQRAPVLELEVRRVDGTYLTAEIHSAPLMYQGKPAVMVVGLDITESKRAEKALKESEQRLELALHGADLGLWDYNLQTGEAFVSQRRAEMVGYSSEELEPHISSWAKQVHPEDRDRVWEAFNAHAKGCTPFYECEHRLRHRSGHYIWILARAKIVEWDKQGNPVRMVGTSLDITERKKAEEALKESERRLELALEAGRLGMWDWNIQTGEMLFNPYGLQMVGASRDQTETAFLSWSNRIHPDDIAGVRAAFNAHFEDGTPFCENEHRLRTDSGRWIWNLARGKVVERDKDGKPLRMIGINQDVTPRKLAEQALRESEERYRALIELAPAGIAIHCDGKMVFVNSVAARDLGAKSPDEIIGRPFTDFIPTHLHEALMQRRDKMLAEWQPAPVIEVPGHRADGSFAIGEIHSGPIMYEGKPAVMVVGLDITDRKKTEEQIKASLEEKEMLLREIHHRVKNNLQVMSSLLALQSGYIDDQGSVNMLRDAERRIYSMALVHENLYRSENLARIKMDSYIQMLVTDLFASYGTFVEAVGVKIDAEDALLGVDAAVPCGLIMNELVSNALKHAFPSGRKGEMRISFHLIGENEFQLTVTDNGVGMPEDLISVKSQSFGLDLVKTLVDQLHGQIALNRDVGTEFRITFKEVRRQRGSQTQ